MSTSDDDGGARPDPDESQGGAPPAEPAGGIKRRLRPALLLLSLGFVAWAAWDLGRRWQTSQVDVAWLTAALSVLPLIVGSLVQTYCWIRLIDRMSAKRVPRGPAVALYLESQIARYLPGKVGLPLVRMAGAPRLGVAASTVGSSVLVEMLSWLAVGSVVGFSLLTVTSEHAGGVVSMLGRAGPWLLACSVLGVGVLLLVDRRRLPNKVLRVLKLGGQGPLVPPGVPVIHVVYWSTWAAHGYLLGHALGADQQVAASATGLFVLAPILGFVVLAAPAGIGVREAVLSLGLAPAVGPAPALAAAILARAASLIADVATWLATRPLGGESHLRPGQ